MATRGVNARIPQDLEAEARGADPELADLPLSTLVRVGLAVLARLEEPRDIVPEAIRVALASRQAPGPKPSTTEVAA